MNKIQLVIHIEIKKNETISVKLWNFKCHQVSILFAISTYYAFIE